ncbi:unnamed protein product [Spirodela intermedia]|uniref:non-specific serine/threonine protein kinase n=1 Tax=Spirodela intermedia TaxID=51605 RepID=A0A7I8KAL6_SPIIN|nr:unnamed protein product [Spirodela intermedia]
MGRRYSFARSVAALLLVAFAAIAGAVNTLEVGKALKDNETLISPEGTFALGFFTGSLDRRYLGIWYHRIPGQTVVWVANRRRPLPGATGELTLSGNGTLVLADAAGTVYWSSPAVAAPATAPVARLLERGNLVVLDGSGESYAWESFSQPTDTLLPGMKIGLNTGGAFNLSPWRSADDPAPGDFSLGIAVSRGVPQLVVTKGSATVWRGGPWIGDRFSGIPAMKANNQFSYGFKWEPDEVYFRLYLWYSSDATRVTINRSGIAEHFLWTGEKPQWEMIWTSAIDACDSYNVCGANGLCNVRESPPCSCPEGFTPRQPPAGGCELKEPLQCRSGTDGFVAVAGAKLPDTFAATVDKTIGFDECKAHCLRNCSCTAFTSSDGTGCITWFGDLDDVRVYNATEGQELFLRVATSQGRPPPLNSHRHRSFNKSK